MRDETHQAQLLDAYLTALQQNPHAPIPSGLDLDMADFAQTIVGEPAENNSQITHERIWQNIQPHIHQEIQIDSIERDHYMENIKEKQKNNSNNRGWLPLVATAAISVLVSLALASVIFGSNDSQFAASPVQDTTAIPISIVLASATFTPTPVSSPTFAPTPLQGTVPPPIQTTSLDTPLECDFEDDLRLEINQNLIRGDEALQIMATVRNRDAEDFYIEIFGGLVTDDRFIVIASSQTVPALDTTLETEVLGNDYPAGSYLVRLRIVDPNGEVRSSCGLPFYIAQ